MNHLETQLKPEYVLKIAEGAGGRITMTLQNGFTFITNKIHFNDFKKFKQAVDSRRP